MNTPDPTDDNLTPRSIACHLAMVATDRREDGWTHTIALYSMRRVVALGLAEFDDDTELRIRLTAKGRAELARMIGMVALEPIDKPDSGWKALPDDAPPRYNGGTRCDMEVGACACGATHEAPAPPVEPPSPAAPRSVYLYGLYATKRPGPIAPDNQQELQRVFANAHVALHFVQQFFAHHSATVTSDPSIRCVEIDSVYYPLRDGSRVIDECEFLRSLRADALSKLTAEEARVLGLPDADVKQLQAWRASGRYGMPNGGDVSKLVAKDEAKL